MVKKQKRRRDGISFRAWDQAWYSSVTGKKQPLRDETGAKIRGRENENTARKAYHRLSFGMLDENKEAMKAFSEVGRSYLQFLTAERTEKATYLAEHAISSLLDYVGTELPANQITPDMLRRWLTKDSWGPHTRHTVLSRISSTFNHGIRLHGLTNNPARGITTSKPQPRSEVYTPDQLKQIFDTLPESLRHLCWFLNETGCRPGEAMKLEARHFVTGEPNGEFILGVAEHKNGRTTQRVRPIFLSTEATELAKTLVPKYPIGKLFRTKQGRAWTSRNADMLFRYHARKLGIPDELKLHSFRHTFATRHIDNGVPIERVATWLGDTVQTVQRVYWHAIHRANRNLFKGLD